MDLHINEDARFTRWGVSGGLLGTPFMVVNIGVQGGENPRWGALGDSAVVHDFDAIEEVIAGLERKNAGRANRHYHWMAAGSEDVERDFYFRLDDHFSSSLYQPGPDRHRIDGRAQWRLRRVRVRRLDTLLEQGAIPRADFLKVDVEGYEKHVLLGAQTLLASTLGVEIESNFGTSWEYPKSHFGLWLELLVAHGLLVFDLSFNRIPRATFQHALRRAGRRTIDDQKSVGRPSTLNVLYCRDFTEETDHPEHFSTPHPSVTVDDIVKLMIIYELHGLNDVAVDTAERFRDRLGTRLDVDEAVRLLTNPRCHTPKMSLDRVVKGLARRLGPAVRHWIGRARGG